MPAWLKKIFTTIGRNTDLILIVKHGSTEVGSLSYSKNEFIFKYNDSCPVQLRIKGLDGEIVRFKHLPPFFTSRIPSFTRPDIKNKLSDIGVDNPIKLLGKFGKKSAVSPYVFILTTLDKYQL